MRTLRVGLVGLGHVGRAAARLFERNARVFQERAGARLELAWICDRHPEKKLKALKLTSKPKVTKDWRQVVADPSVDIVIELVGGNTEARALDLAALAAGKRVVTANKHVVAAEWPKLQAAAKRGGGDIAFEGAVAGAVPVLQALRQGLAANEITGITGILNGTTNHILTEMAHKGVGYEEALKEAQAGGLAERDPSMDVDGHDAAHKLSILASVVTGAWVSPDKVDREGIRAITAQDVGHAVTELGRAIRLLGRLKFDWKGGAVRIEAGVYPTLVPLDHPLAAVHGAYNAVLVQASEAKDLLFSGLGAGPEPAASAVLGDVLATARDLLSGGRTLPSVNGGPKVTVAPADETESQFYLRLDAQDKPGVLARVTGILARETISIARIRQAPVAGSKRIPVVITTHPARWGAMRRAVAALAKAPGVHGRPVCLRLL